MCISKLFILCVFSVTINICFQWPFNSHSLLIRYILQSINFFVFKCERPVNHSGGMLISPDSCDNQKLWCKSRLYPEILSAEIISFTRDAPSSFYPSPVPPSPCPLCVCLISSLFPAWSWAGGMSVMHILPGRMHSCRAQHPVPFVSTSSTSLKLCGTYAAPGFTPPPSFLPFLWAPSIFQNLPLLQSGNGTRGLSQPTTLPSHEPSAHDDAQAGLPSWR